jgi:hypothetical protein
VGLVRAHRTCEQPGDAPLRLGFRALETFRTDEGFTGGQPRAENPATAWAMLAYASGSEALDDRALREKALAARQILLRGQNADGGFRFLPAGDEPSNAYSTVLALWALAETEPLGSDADAEGARHRAAGWIRRALVEDVDEPPVRTVAGLYEQATWVLLRTRERTGDREAGDERIFRTAAQNIIERCALENRRCTRPIYEDGRTYLERVPGEGPTFLALWHPWATLAASALAGDDSIDLPDEVRDTLRVIAAWGLAEIETGIAVLTAAPDYKLAEYLYVASTLAE